MHEPLTGVHKPSAKWKRLLPWVLFGTFLIPTGLLSGIAVMNYSGYCFAQSRYLNEEERIEQAIKAVIAGYPRITYAYDELPKPGYEVIDDKHRCCTRGDISRYDKSRGGTSLDANQLIPYRSIEEFRLINPDCCSFAREGLYGELGKIDRLWPKITGYSAGFANVKFRVRYRDENGEIRSKLSAFSQHQTNCGAAVWPD